MSDREARGEPLAAGEVRLVEGVAREQAALPCPACGRAVAVGQDIVTTLGDVDRGAVGVTVHKRCYAAIGRTGVLELMIAAYQQRTTLG